MAFILFLVVMATNTVMQGFLIKTFWSWFVVTQFEHLPQCSLLVAIGFAMFVKVIVPLSFMTERELAEIKEGDFPETLKQNALFSIGGSILTLGVGWLIHYLM